MLALAIYPYFLLAADLLRSILALEVQHHAYLQVLEPRHWLIAVVIRNEPIKSKAQFISKDEIVLTKQKIFKRSLILSIQVILDDIVPVDLCEEVVRIFELCSPLKGLLVLFLHHGKHT